MENLKNYFENIKGTGVMATADEAGKVNAAVYSRPHFPEGGAVAFIMRDRLTYHNLKSNPNAAFLFIEEGTGYKGKRLYLKKIREEENSELIDSLSRREYKRDKSGARFLVFFEVEKVLPLIGAGGEISK